MCNRNAGPYPGAHVEYSFCLDGVTFDPFSVPLTHSRVTEARFKMMDRDDPEENNCTMILMLGPVASIEEADQIADSVKDRLLELFSLIIGSKVGITRRIGHNLRPRPGEDGHLHAIRPCMRVRFRGHSQPRRVTDDEIRKIQDAFASASNLAHSSVLRLFRYALNIDDVVARFLMLYLILYLLRSNQREVDRLITRVEPGVDQTPDPRNSGVMETCYTRLRNEITHRDVDHESTRQEISRRVYDLANVVRTVIRQEYRI